MTDENRVKLGLIEWKRRIETKQNWHTPLGIVVALALALLTTSSFQAFGWLTADMVKGVLLTSLVMSVVWLGLTIVSACTAKGSSVDEFVEELKRGSTRIDMTTLLKAAASQVTVHPAESDTSQPSPH